MIPHLRAVFIFLSVLFFRSELFSLIADTSKLPKPPRHYFKSIYILDFYANGKRDLSSSDFISKKLKSYRVSQFSFGFLTPLFTKVYYSFDSTCISNFHLLLSGSYVSLKPKLEGITSHNLVKSSVGFRCIYNNGKRSVFYYDFSPFTTVDRGKSYTRQSRLATTLIYSLSMNNRLAFRLGYVRSFLFGNRYHLPFIGLRVGRLDGLNFSVQFPRSVSINFPFGKFLKTSFYTKPLGGVYTFANSDTIYYLNNDRKIYFGRYEFLTGCRIDFNSRKFFSCYFSGGITSRNFIGFFSDSYNKNNKGFYHAFYRANMEGSLFVNLGLVVKLGKVKSIYNNYNLYEIHDLNSTDFNNLNSGLPQIPPKNSKINDVQPLEVLDLLDSSELY